MELNLQSPLFTLTIEQFMMLTQQVVETAIAKKGPMLLSHQRLNEHWAASDRSPIKENVELISGQVGEESMFVTLLERISILETLVRQQNVLQKEMLTFEEAHIYTGFSRSYLYKLTTQRKIATYKPGGKLIYFKRSDIDAFLKGRRTATEDELKTRAVEIIEKAKSKKAGRW